MRWTSLGMVMVVVGCAESAGPAEPARVGEAAWRLGPTIDGRGVETTAWHDIDGRVLRSIVVGDGHEAEHTYRYGEFGVDVFTSTLDGELFLEQVWFYDEQGRPTRIDATVEGVSGVTQHTYEGDLLVRTEQSSDDWRSVSVYDYDDAGRLVAVSTGEPLTVSSTRTYDAPPPSLDHTEVRWIGWEVSFDRRYDDRDRLVSVVSRYDGVVGSEQWFAWSDDVVVRDEYRFAVDDSYVQRVTTYFDDGRIDRRVDTDEDSGEVLSEYVAEWTRL